MAIGERWTGHPQLPAGLEERLPAVATRLRRAGADLVYLFGSAGRSDRRSDRPRDLDLAVWGMEEDPSRVRADLEDLLGTDRLDLIRLEDADAELRFEVIARGRRLYAASVALENRVELKILREYQDLAPFRRTQTEHLRLRYGVDGP